nr:hypothetical protein [Tanacetum cinerariifolium]
HSISGHSLPEHASPDTTVDDSSTPSRFVHPLLVRTPRCSEAYLHWRSAPLSTMDSSFESSVGPSRKRCRSPAATMTSSIHATRALVLSRADLLPPRKRFRDSISPEVSVAEDIDTDVLEDIEADAMAIEVAVDRDVVTGVDAGIDIEVDVWVDIEDEVESIDRGTMEVGVDVAAGIDILDGMLMSDARDRVEQVEEGLHDIYEHVIKIPLQMIKDIETRQRELGARSFIAGGERASLLDQVASLRRSNVRLRGTMMMERARANRFWRRAIEELVNRRVEEALAAYKATCAASALEAENQSQNGSDDDDGNGGNGNGGDGNGGNGNPNKDNRGARPVARECTYKDFMKCQPLNFNGTKGVVGLKRWFKKMETVFHINNCLEKYKVKYSTCTLLNSALTWWNSHKKTTGADAAFSMLWRVLMKLMAELTMMFTKIVPEEEDRVKKFIGGLPNNIKRNVIATEPIRLQDAVQITNNLMDQKLKELGSFDVIIGMDCLENHHVVIECDEMIMRIPYGDEVLIVQGDGSDKGKKKKETKDKSEEKQLEDVPIVRDFPEDLHILQPLGGADAVASPVGVLELDTYSSSKADPSNSSPPPVYVAPMVLPFLCSDDSKVASRSSSPTTSTPEIPTAPILLATSVIVAPSSEFPLAPVVAPLEIRQRRVILIRPEEDIPIGRLYRTHPGGPCRALTTRKSVKPLPSHRFAL